MYTKWYCDGDSKSYDRVKQVYKDKHTKEVERLQCVGHVQKCMGTALRKLKKDVKGLGGKRKDHSRIKIADHQQLKRVKQRRKQLRGRKKQKIDQIEHQEGLQYGPGEFAT